MISASSLASILDGALKAGGHQWSVVATDSQTLRVHDLTIKIVWGLDDQDAVLTLLPADPSCPVRQMHVSIHVLIEQPVKFVGRLLAFRKKLERAKIVYASQAAVRKRLTSGLAHFQAAYPEAQVQVAVDPVGVILRLTVADFERLLINTRRE